MCKGQCPGTAIDQDWRNRTDHCEVWLTLYQDLEAEMLTQGKFVLSADAVRATVERAMLVAWAEGQQITMSAVLAAQRTGPSWQDRLRDLRARVAAGQ
jgi:uncharacterized protein